MKKKPTRIVKIQIEAGKCTPAPPVGTALGPTGIQVADFCKQFNDKTADMQGDIVPAVLNIYEDRTFDFVLKTTPASRLILKAAGIPKGSGKNAVKKVGKITKDQAKQIAEQKMVDLNATDIDEAMKIIEGTARSMGIDVS